MDTHRLKGTSVEVRQTILPVSRPNPVQVRTPPACQDLLQDDGFDDSTVRLPPPPPPDQTPFLHSNSGTSNAAVHNTSGNSVASTTASGWLDHTTFSDQPWVMFVCVCMYVLYVCRSVCAGPQPQEGTHRDVHSQAQVLRAAGAASLRGRRAGRAHIHTYIHTYSRLLFDCRRLIDG